MIKESSYGKSNQEPEQMAIDTTKLRELAQKATPGNWTLMVHTADSVDCFDTNRDDWSVSNEGGAIVAAEFGLKTDSDVRYITAANPATVLQLLDEIDRLRTDKDHVTSMFESTAQQLQKALDLIEKRQKIEAAARNLAKAKGRHHSELAMNQLLEALK